jgi:hypothetical protein
MFDTGEGFVKKPTASTFTFSETVFIICSFTSSMVSPGRILKLIVASATVGMSYI